MEAEFSCSHRDHRKYMFTELEELVIIETITARNADYDSLDRNEVCNIAPKIVVRRDAIYAQETSLSYSD